MGKHNKARRPIRGGQIVVAAAAASVLAGWAAPVAYADDGAADNDTAVQSGQQDGPTRSEHAPSTVCGRP